MYGSLLAACSCTVTLNPCAAQMRPEVTTTPEAVYGEWDQNEAAACVRYEGKDVQVTGASPVVSASQFAGSSRVRFRANYTRVITCTFDDARKAQLQAISGDQCPYLRR